MPNGLYPSPRGRDSSAMAGLYLANVTRVDGNDVYLEVPALAADLEYPARAPLDYAPEPGHQVAAGFLDGGRDELVVVVRLA